MRQVLKQFSGWVVWVSKAGFSVRIGFSTIAATPHDPCGKELAPDSGDSGNTWLTHLPLSGASPLPHLDRRRLQDCCAACHSGGAWVSKAGFSVRVGFSTIAATPHDPCGRGLAPDSGDSGNTWLTDLPLSGASRIVAPPLPHLDRCRLQDCCATGLLTAQSPKWLCWKISAPFAPPPDAPDFHCLGYNN